MRYTEHYQVMSHDIDVNGNVRPTMLLIYLQETANHQMRDRRPTYNELFDQHISFIITRLSLEVFAQLHEYDEIEVDTWAAGMKKATFLRGYEIRRGEETVARAWGEWTTVDIVEGGVLPVTRVDLSNYESDEPPVLDLPEKFRFPKDLAFQDLGSHRVDYSEVDMNAHMNNTRYADILWSNIPDVQRKVVTSINLRFRKEGLIGTDLKITRAPLDSDILKDPRAEEGWGFRTQTDGKVNIEAMFGMKDEGYRPLAFEVKGE